MSTFATRVVQIESPVEHHPDADRLSLIRIGGYICIDRKNEDGSHRLKQGDWVVYIPEASVLPEDLLRSMSMWKPAKLAEDGSVLEPAKGGLDGQGGNRVRARKLRGIFSQGLVYPVELDERDGSLMLRSLIWINGEDMGSNKYTVVPDQDVHEILGITKWEPPIPLGMAGEVCVVQETARFDFESIQSVPDLFAPNELVSVTEKGHGTFVQIGYVPSMENAECFGSGRVYVTSKGLGNQRLGFKNNEANERNLYVRILRANLDQGLLSKFESLSAQHGGAEIRVFGEIMGQGIQDLHYGFTKPELRIFDVKIGDLAIKPETTEEWAVQLGFQTMPTLWAGAYNLDELIKYRDGKDSFSNSHVREGIVIRAQDGGRHPIHGRKIGKWVSPAYLLRSNKNATEYQ